MVRLIVIGGGAETHRLRNMEGGWTGECSQDKFTQLGGLREIGEREKEEKRRLLQQNHLIAKDPSNPKMSCSGRFFRKWRTFFLP